ncbi:unnamed protein product, partial [Ectocarpus sp. 6 AP-2014]
MVFARFGSLVFVQWKDSKLVKFLSTIHLSPKHFLPKEYSKHVAGQAKKADGFQPWCRFHFNKFMGGVDISDQHNGAYQTQHR